MTPPSSHGYGRFRLDSARGKPRKTVQTGRRSHQKSRTGCRTCKKDRLKCDETHPTCRRCSQRKRMCEYDGIHRYYSESSTACSPVVASQGGLSLEHSLMDGLINQSFTHSLSITNTTHLMHNLVGSVHTSLATPIGKFLFDHYILPHCAATPRLLHSLFALSARHLQHLQPRCLSHTTAHYFHASHAAELLNDELGRVASSPQNLGMIYATCIVLNMGCFASDDYHPSSSWVFQDTAEIDQSFTWFTLQSGLGYVSSMLKNQVHQTFWRLKAGSRGSSIGNLLTWATKDPSHTGSLEKIPDFLLDLCEITPDSSPENNPYYIPICLLSQMLPLKKPVAQEFDHLLIFGPLIPHSFRILLRDRDERALVLFLIWLRLLGRGDFWWVNTRVEAESRALMAFLRHSEDGEIRSVVDKIDF
ncbi:hypothetical protein KXW57_000889 [Aspergillus fumigatus]|uniref:C6 transcription factor, putative n=2 Tax=Aspergillus fumigatus TaxID=746128 RepID=Q4WIW0_ASPFU|nr:C6 transcription factor, putative [Aspergillus fumigatus Af293]EDP53711.1 C6 transcription factor, putative [Aspergillus fumigatus A1163]KAH2380707.1 hypothetical protein KXV98_003784 [Aspergillus fumigatus]EAL87145.1 C6 transcription factor, putative [Aspergillus fumigatus Af293]KAH3251245.1 hypothetical protein KXW57_000889 [Aspergillus fumigatus]KAH3308552.1 hypothetical protein KXV19_007318 [Aspergillus fumigatus]